MCAQHAALQWESLGLGWKRPGKANALPCNMESVWTGRMSSPLGYILRWWWPVLASEEMVVSSSGEISAL